MDKDLEKILNKAKSGEPAPTEVPLKVFPKNLPYDHLVFTKLVSFAGFNKLIFLFVLPGMISIGFFFAYLRIYTLYILIGYFILVAIHQIANAIRYHFFFNGWQERLPFKLVGWNEMIHEKKMFCDLCWNHTRIEVVTTNESPEILELVQAALTIFSKKSKRAFYNRKIGSSSTHHRQDWKVISSCVAEGSANPEVMGRMKDVFEKELSIIAKKTEKIKAVNVTLLSEEFQIKIEITVGNT